MVCKNCWGRSVDAVALTLSPERRETMTRSLSSRKAAGGLFVAMLILFLAAGAETTRLDARPPHIDGKQVAERVDRVMAHYGWHDSLEELKQTAAKRKKLILWLQLVGNLDGGL